MMRFMPIGVLVFSLTLGFAGKTWANVDDDYFDACARLGQGDKCHTCDSDWYGFPSHCAAMLDIAVRKANQQCLTGTCISTGKVTANVEFQPKYVDSHNSVWVGSWGSDFGYFDPGYGNGPLSRYKVSSALFTTSTVRMAIQRAQSLEMVYASPVIWTAPAGYDFLQGVGVF